ncbi:hypothetical protein HW572_04260 [Gordonia amicalis]|nr:hypothetical protein [Gordonia amicalis]
MESTEEAGAPAATASVLGDEIFAFEPTAAKTTAEVTREGDDVVLSRWRLGGPSRQVERISHREWTTEYDLAAERSDEAQDDDATASTPEDEAVLLLLLGWRVSCTPTVSGATVVATPQRDGSVDVGAQWRSLDLEPDSAIELSWQRPCGPQTQWNEIADQTGVRDSHGNFIALDGQTLDALKFLLAPAWISTAFTSDREGWHSKGGHVAPSFLASDFLVGVDDADQEVVKARLTKTDNWSRAHGMAGPFDTVKDVVAHLNDTGQPFVGCYLVALANGHCYIGETVNFRDRLSTHKRTFVDQVYGFYVRPDAVAASMSPREAQKDHLHLVEQKLIHEAQESKLIAENFREMAHPIDEFVGFTQEIQPSEAERWFEDPVAANRSDTRPLRALETHQHGGKQSKFSSLASRSEAGEIVGIVHDYLTRCVPYPARTEMVSWSLSCLPGVQRGDRGARSNVLACLSISMTEVLTLLQNAESGQCWGFLAVNDVELGQDDDLQFIRLLRRHPGIDIEASRYHEFGPGVSMIYAPNLPALRRLLDDVEVTRAAATVALRLCRVGPSRQINVHNPYLVEAALGQSRRWT